MSRGQRFGLLGLVALLLAAFWAGLWYQERQEGATVILTPQGEEEKESSEVFELKEDAGIGAGEKTEVSLPENKESEEAVSEEEKEKSLPKEIAVHVIGRVCSPGLYFLPEGSRIFDAVEAAVPEENADLTRLNLALPAEDGMQIRVPTIGIKGEWESDALVLRSGDEASRGGSTAVFSQERRININQAGAEELMTLPGIGQTYARRIIEYREKEGAFRLPEEIKKVKGIGEAKYEELKDLILCD